MNNEIRDSKGELIAVKKVGHWYGLHNGEPMDYPIQIDYDSNGYGLKLHIEELVYKDIVIYNHFAIYQGHRLDINSWYSFKDIPFKICNWSWDDALGTYRTDCGYASITLSSVPSSDLEKWSHCPNCGNSLKYK